MPLPAFSTTTGFGSPTFDEILVDIRDKYEAQTGILVDLNQGEGNADPTLGWMRTLAAITKGTYDDMAGTYASGFVGTSSGAGLRNLLYPYIGEPLAATASVVELICTGTPLAVIGSPVSVTLTSDGASAVRWSTTAPFAFDGAGFATVEFTYEATGPKSAAAGSNWTIATPTPDWTGVGVNAAPAAEGRDAETDIEYRLRFEASTRYGALLAAVLGVDGVTSANLFENPTDIPDAFWGATHWLEVLVVGGADDEIAQAIFDNRAFGVNTLGTDSGIAVAPAFPGGTAVQEFSRQNDVDVWTELTIVKGEGYPADNSAAAIAAREQAIRDQILAWASTRAVGLDVTAFQVATVAAVTPAVPGIANISPAFVGLVNPPLDATVVAGPRDLLIFDAARIILNGV